MGLRRWFQTVLVKVRRGQQKRRSVWLYERCEPRLYITQLEERRVLSASPVPQELTDFAVAGAMSNDSLGSSSLTFEHAALPLASPTPSAAHDPVGTFRDDGLGSVTSSKDALPSPEVAVAVQGTQAYFSDGNLLIEALGEKSSNDLNLQLVRQKGAEYVQISDPSSLLLAGKGVLQVDAHTLWVPTAALTGNITVIGSNGDNALTIDLNGGNPITEVGLVFLAGEGHDDITIMANGEDAAFFLGRTVGRGMIKVGGRTIRFAGVESDTVTLAEAATLTLNLTGSDTVQFSQVSKSRSRAEGLSNAIEFDSPTQQLVVNVLDKNDYALHFNSLAADFNPVDGIEINGGGGSETLLIDYSHGNSVPKAGIHFDGGSGADLLQIHGTETENPVYRPDASLFGSGMLHIGGRTISFAGLEPVDFDSVGTLTLMLPGGDDVVDINTGTLGDGISAALVLSGNSGGVSFEQARVRRSAIVIDTTVNDGADRITITQADNAHDNTHLTILTGVGFDMVTVNGKALFAGNVVIATVDLTVDEGFQAGGTMTITNAGTFTTAKAGEVLADGGFTQDGAGENVLAGNITTAGGNIRFATAVTLTDDATISTGATGGDIVFGSTVDSQATEASSLTVTTGAGNVSFTGPVGSATDGQLGALLVASARDVTFWSTVQTTGDVTQAAGDGTTTFHGTSGNGIGGNLSVTTDTISLDSTIVTTVGDVNLSARNAISIKTGAGLDAGASRIAIAAGESGGALGFTQADGTTIRTTNASNGAITITVGGTGGAAIAALQTGDAGRVTITAGGAIRDGNGPTTNITATTVALRAKTGIGTDSDAIETAQAGHRLTVAAKSESGDIHLIHTGCLIVGTVDGLEGVTITDSDGTATGNDSIHLTASSFLTVHADVVNNDGGDGSIFFRAGSDLVINAAVRSERGDVRLQAARDIVVQSLVQAGEDLTLLADSDGDGRGGLWVQDSGKLAASGDIAARGSDVFRTIASEADRTEPVQVVLGPEGMDDGIRVDTDADHADADQMVAAGRIMLGTNQVGNLVLRGVVRTSGTGFLDLDASGSILLGTSLATGGGRITLLGPTLLIGDTVLTTNATTELTDDHGTPDPSLSGDVWWGARATIDSRAGEHNNLVLRAGTGIIGFGANLGQTVALQSLTVEDTTGGVIFGTSDAAAVDSDTGPVTLVRLNEDLVLGDGMLDHAGISGGVVFNGGAPADRLLVHTLEGAIRIRGDVTLGSTTTFRHTGEASLNIRGGTLNIVDADSQLIIDALTALQADAPTDASPSGIIDSRIDGAGRLVKTGAGWLKLTSLHDNTYSGGTTIAGGTLSISRDGHLGSVHGVPTPGSVIIDGARLYVRSDVPLDQLPYTFWLDGHRGIALGPSSGVGYGEVFVQRDVMVMIGGVVANNEGSAGSLRKTGGGILMLNGENTYTGTTYITAGTLLINGSTDQASTVYVGGDRADVGVWIGGEPIRVTEQYAMLGGVGVVHGNVHVLGVSEVSSQWVPEPPGGHVNPGSILDQAEWISMTKPDGTVVETWGLPTVPGILTVGPIQFLPNAYLNIDFGNGGEVDPETGWGKASGFPYPGGGPAWADAFADWQSQAGPERGLPPVDRTGYDQLRVMDDLTLDAAILRPNLQYVPLAWEAQFLIADFDGDGQVFGTLFQDRTYTIDGEDYVLRYDRGPNSRSIAFEAAGFTPVFRALPTPTAPVLIVARGFEPVAPAALRPYQEPPPPPLANLAAGSEVVGGSERFIEVRVVTPVDDAGGVEETTVLKLPVSVLQDLRRLVGALPDDRYRVYLIVEYGQGRTSEEFLVRDLYVREGRPVERDTSQPEAAQPATDDDAPGELQPDPNDGKRQDTAEDSGSPASVAPGAIAVAGAAVWQARVDRAIARHANRLPSKAIRLYQRMRTAAQTALPRTRSDHPGEKGPSE